MDEIMQEFEHFILYNEHNRHINDDIVMLISFFRIISVTFGNLKQIKEYWALNQLENLP